MEEKVPQREEKKCSVEGCEERIYAKGKCKKHYFQECRKGKRYSKQRQCEGCGTRIMDKAKLGLCKSCVQKARRGNLIKQERTGSGAVIFSKYSWAEKKWKVLGLSEMEARKVWEEILEQQCIEIIERDSGGEIISRRPALQVGTLLEDGQVKWHTRYWD